MTMAIGLEAELQSLTDKVGRGDPAKKHVFLMARALSFLQHIEACCTGVAQLGDRGGVPGPSRITQSSWDAMWGIAESKQLRAPSLLTSCRCLLTGLIPCRLFV